MGSGCSEGASLGLAVGLGVGGRSDGVPLGASDEISSAFAWLMVHANNMKAFTSTVIDFGMFEEGPWLFRGARWSSIDFF